MLGQFRMLRIALATAFLAPVSGLAADGGFCVENAADHAYLFVAETREGERRVATLQPGELLCSGTTAATDGVVNVFESADALEGCGRILAKGETERFVAYAEFDRCEWGAHGS